MTRKELEKNATLICEKDHYDGDIYLYTDTFYLYDNKLYCSTQHSNLNRYTGENRTEIVIDDVENDIEKYNELYFWEYAKLTPEGYQKLYDIVTMPERFAVVTDWKNLTKDIEWFPAERQATEHAEYSLNRFSREELKKIESFYVLKSINPDPEADNHWDGNIVWEADIAAELDK